MLPCTSAVSPLSDTLPFGSVWITALSPITRSPRTMSGFALLNGSRTPGAANDKLTGARTPTGCTVVVSAFAVELLANRRLCATGAITVPGAIKTPGTY